MIKNYKAIIFDWDGTIVDTCGLILDAHNHVRENMGHAKWTLDDFLGQASKSAREYYPEIYGDKSDDAQHILYEYVDEHHLKYLDPMASAPELLSHIQQLKLPMGVVSNKRHSNLMIEIETVQYLPYFTSMIGAGFAEKDKPSPVPLLMAMAEIDAALNPQDVLYVGDTETDLMTAQNTGCDCVLIQSDRPRPDLIAKYNPAYAYHSLAEFYADVTQGDIDANKVVA